MLLRQFVELNIGRKLLQLLPQDLDQGDGVTSRNDLTLQLTTATTSTLLANELSARFMPQVRGSAGWLVVSGVSTSHVTLDPWDT